MVYIKLKVDYVYHIYICFIKSGILIFKILLSWPTMGLSTKNCLHQKFYLAIKYRVSTLFMKYKLK